MRDKVSVAVFALRDHIRGAVRNQLYSLPRNGSREGFQSSGRQGDGTQSWCPGEAHDRTLPLSIRQQGTSRGRQAFKGRFGFRRVWNVASAPAQTPYVQLVGLGAGVASELGLAVAPPQASTWLAEALAAPETAPGPLSVVLSGRSCAELHACGAEPRILSA